MLSFLKQRPGYSARGFTLIELLIVVAIIAIISAIAVPRMLKAFNQAKDKHVMSEMRNFAIAIGIYRIDHEMVPDTNSGCTDRSADIAELVVALQDYRGKDQLPINEKDAWGHEFYYCRTSQDQYTLISFGRDGGPGNLANTEGFDPDADTVLITGVFVASHQGVTAVVGK